MTVDTLDGRATLRLILIVLADLTLPFLHFR